MATHPRQNDLRLIFGYATAALARDRAAKARDEAEQDFEKSRTAVARAVDALAMANVAHGSYLIGSGLVEISNLGVTFTSADKIRDCRHFRDGGDE
ncbi:MAG: hypothetical protein ABL982_03485 [Vicinamibacterales bacterium]